MAYSPIAFDPIAYDVTQSAVHVYTTDNSYWIPLKCLVEVYDNTGNTLLISYDMFNPESNPIKLLECTVSLGLTNTQFTLKFEDGHGIIDQNIVGLGNKILVYAGRSSDNLTLLFTGYSENRSPTIISDKVMDYEMTGYGENATLNDLIVNFKRASSSLTDISDPNFPKRPDSKMVVFELVKDLFEDQDVRATKDLVIKDYLNLDISGISPLVTERLLSIVQSMTEASQVLNFLTEVTGAYWKIENGKLYFEYPEVQHSGIVIKNKVSSTDLASNTSYFLGPWTYTDSISKDKGFANRIYTTTATDTKSVANSMTNHGATALFDRAIAVQVQLLETRVNTIALIMSKIGDPFTPLSDDEDETPRGGPPPVTPPPQPTPCPQGYHKDASGQCVPDVTPPVCPLQYHWDPATQRCVPDVTPPTTGLQYTFNSKFGSQGNGNGQFQDPHDISFDSMGRVFVTDRIRNDIQIFTHTGNYITKFGGTGTGPGQFRVPYSCAHDVDDNLYVADRENNRIQKFNRCLTFVTQITTANGRAFNMPEDIVFDPVNGDIYICDTGNNRIVKFDNNHNFIREWGSLGSGDGQFDHPHSSDVGPDRNYYVNSGNQPYIQKFSPEGQFIKKWGSAGTHDGQLLTFLEHMDIDIFGRLHIINNNARPVVQVFDLEGNFLTKYGQETEGSADGQFREPEHVTCDASGNPYVVDAKNQRVQIFKPNTIIQPPPTPPPIPICPTGYNYDPTSGTCILETTPPPPPATLYRFISWGDNDTTLAAHDVLDQIMTEPNVAGYLFAGDGPYSNSGTAWVNMMTSYFPADKKAKLSLAQGNHEHTESQSQQTEDDIEAWFPGLNNATEGLEWLTSKKVGNVFIINLNSQDPNIDQVGGVQYNWVRDRLLEAKALRASGQIDWIITVVHKSWFNLLGSNPAYVTARHAYAAIFRDAQVDFMFHGHNHSYCIWKPIVDISGNDENTAAQAVFTLLPDGRYDFSKDHGAFYIINGNGGHEINPWGENPADFPNVLYANDTEYGYTVLDIEGKQAKITAKNVDGQEKAIINVTRGSTTTPPPPPPPPDPDPGGSEGQIDSYGIEWKVARGQQFVVDMSRDQADDDRWSGNVTGLRNGVEATFIGKSIGIASDGHFAMKIFGGNHSGTGASSMRWYDLGLRSNGDVQLQWEGPHPNNHDFTLPDTKWFIKNIGKGLEGNWIGLKWVVQTMVTNGSPANGGVRCRMWVDTDPMDASTNKPKNNWRLCLDFIDGIDVDVISPDTYQAPDEQDCEVRRSGTTRHDVYGTGTIVLDSKPGDPGLHVRRFGTAATTLVPANVRTLLQKRKKPPQVTDPNKVVGKPCKVFKEDKRKVTAAKVKHTEKRLFTMMQVHEESGFSVDNKIVQSASQLPEQVVRGEIRIDNEDKPTGPVISQFKVEVGSLSSTADTIFVNDIKVDASVLSPNGKYWLVLMPCGTSARNTVLWHHDGDLTTINKFSAFAKGETRNDLSDWQISRYGPTYCHAIFARLRRIQEYSDPQSISRFRLKEDIAEADFLDDSVSVAKMMQNVLAIRGKPVREYSINEVTLPTGKWFTPGQNVTIVDDTGHHEEGKNIFAEIQEVSYTWSTSAADKTIGTFKVNVLPVGHLNWHRELFPAGD